MPFSRRQPDVHSKGHKMHRINLTANKTAHSKHFASPLLLAIVVFSGQIENMFLYILCCIIMISGGYHVMFVFTITSDLAFFHPQRAGVGLKQRALRAIYVVLIGIWSVWSAGLADLY